MVVAEETGRGQGYAGLGGGEQVLLLESLIWLSGKKGTYATENLVNCKTVLQIVTWLKNATHSRRPKWFTFQKPTEFTRGHILHWTERYYKSTEMRDEISWFWKGGEKDVHRCLSWKRSGAVITGCFPMSDYCSALIYPPSTPLTLTLSCHSRKKWK